MRFTLAAFCVTYMLCSGGSAPAEEKELHMPNDAFSYLEDGSYEGTQNWVRAQNERTASAIESDPRFSTYYRQVLASIDAQGALGNQDSLWALADGWAYQLWSDAERHPKGIWRRTRLRALLASRPKWQNLLDVDFLAESDGRPWTLLSVRFAPNGHRCMLGLSDGGSMTIQWREFDVDVPEFPADGFRVPETQGSNVAWWNDDTLFVAAESGAGSLADNGFPIVVRKWRRRRPPETAEIILKGRRDGPSFVSLWPQYDPATVGGPRRNRTIVIGGTDYDWWQYGSAGKLQRMTLPPVTSAPTMFERQYVFSTSAQTDWTVGGITWKAGSLLSIPVAEIGRKAPAVQRVLELPDGEAVMGLPVAVKGGLVVFTTNAGNVSARRVRLVRGRWQAERIPIPPGLIREAMSDAAYGSMFVTLQSDLLPQSLYRLDVQRNTASRLLSVPPQFDSDPFVTEQFEATSADGTKVPYRVTHRRDWTLNGQAPVLLRGYGAFGATELPTYWSALGMLWLQKGGVSVVAGVRGGSERGPGWHVRRADRQRSYDDMLAVTQDLIDRRITAAKRIGIMGASAGGLLAGVMITQHPELYGAAVLLSPLLDNFRGDLLAGGPQYEYSEFGSPQNPVEREFLERTSPFQNLRKVADFPQPLILTATNDQNVFPAQPRRFAAKLDSLGLPFYFNESSEGGHGAAAAGAGQARLDTMIFVYLQQRLMDPHSGHAGAANPANGS